MRTGAAWCLHRSRSWFSNVKGSGELRGAACELIRFGTDHLVIRVNSSCDMTLVTTCGISFGTLNSIWFDILSTTYYLGISHEALVLARPQMTNLNSLVATESKFARLSSAHAHKRAILYIWSIIRQLNRKNPLGITMSASELIPAGPPPPGISSNFKNPESIAGKFIGLAIFFLTLTVIVVTLRLYTQIVILRRLGIDDCEYITLSQTWLRW